MAKIQARMYYDASMPADWVINAIAEAGTRAAMLQNEIDDMEANRRIDAMYPIPTQITGFWGGMLLAIGFAILMVILIILGSN